MQRRVFGEGLKLLRSTYELYVSGAAGQRVFEPLTCFDTDLTAQVNRLLHERNAQSIEVHQFGRHLFTMGGKALHADPEPQA